MDFKKIDWCRFKNVLLLVLIWRLIVFVLAALGYFLLPEAYSPGEEIFSPWRENFLFWSWGNFDTQHFFAIARQGYSAGNLITPLFTFFPVYPLLVAGLGVLFSGDYFVSAQLIILIALPLLIYSANRVMYREGINNKKILKINLLFLFSPGGVFLNAFYTELPFLLFIILSAYFLKKQNFFWAIIFSALATGTRVVGIFWALAIFYYLIKNDKFAWFNKLILTSLSAGGIISYSLFLWLRFGDPFLFGTSQKSWGKAQLVSPLVTFYNYFRTIFSPPANLSQLNYYVVVIEIIIALLGLFLLTTIWYKKLRYRLSISPYLVFTTGCFLLPLWTGSLGTMPRYFLTFISFFPIIIAWHEKQKKVFRLISTIVWLITFASGVILFTRGYWWA